MTLSGVPLRQILSSLRLSNPNIQAISRTVYNAKAKIIKEILANRTMLEALFEEFSQGDFIFDMKRDDDGHLTHLFFAHPSSVALTTSYANENQYKEITTKLASEKLRFPHKFQDRFFRQLVRNVSIFVLKAIYKQYELARSDSLLTTCKGQFSNVMGLPCAHMMRNNKDGFLHLNDIYPQWRIDIVSFTTSEGRLVDQGEQIKDILSNFHSKYQQMPLTQKEDSQKVIAQLLDYQIPLITEPTIQPHKGRPLGSRKRKGMSSTTRDPWEFEIVEKGQKCSVCQAVGHNSRTCPQKRP